MIPDEDESMIRTASGEYNLSDEINRLLTLFHLEPGWKDAYNYKRPQGRHMDHHAHRR